MYLGGEMEKMQSVELTVCAGLVGPRTTLYHAKYVQPTYSCSAFCPATIPLSQEASINIVPLLLYQYINRYSSRGGTLYR